jgi:hypothetical protein
VTIYPAAGSNAAVVKASLPCYLDISLPTASTETMARSAVLLLAKWFLDGCSMTACGSPPRAVTEYVLAQNRPDWVYWLVLLLTLRYELATAAEVVSDTSSHNG